MAKIFQNFKFPAWSCQNFSTETNPGNLIGHQFRTVHQARVLVNRANQLSRGVGFIHFRTPEEAKAAIEALHDTLPEGEQEGAKLFKVTKAKVAKPKRGRG